MQSCVLMFLGIFASLAVFSKGLSTRSDASILGKNDGLYRYFAYGSNMCLDTMTDIRGLNPIASSPAILRNYELVFDIPGIPFVEPCWASVQKSSTSNSAVHGIVYDLSPDDFVAVCRTEGVPFAYQIERCKVQKYASHEDLRQSSNISDRQIHVEAYTLVRSILIRSEIGKAPSQSYLNVMIRGAVENGLDPSYIKGLPGMTIGKGTAETSLILAKLSQQIRKGYI